MDRRTVNKAEKERYTAIKESGCIATMIATGRYSQPPDVHHLTDGGRRRGWEYSIGLSPYHHRGLLPANMRRQRAMGIYGPSFAHGRREFEAFFGGDDYLLRVQNEVLRIYQEMPWFDYKPHRIVFQAIREL